MVFWLFSFTSVILNYITIVHKLKHAPSLSSSNILYQNVHEKSCDSQIFRSTFCANRMKPLPNFA